MQQLGIITGEVASMDTDTKSGPLGSVVTMRPMLVIQPRSHEDSSNVVNKHGAVKDTIEGMQVASKMKTCNLYSCL
jgi:hypothetical protein